MPATRAKSLPRPPGSTPIIASVAAAQRAGDRADQAVARQRHRDLAGVGGARRPARAWRSSRSGSPGTARRAARSAASTAGSAFSARPPPAEGLTSRATGRAGDIAPSILPDRGTARRGGGPGSLNRSASEPAIATGVGSCAACRLRAVARRSARARRRGPRRRRRRGRSPGGRRRPGRGRAPRRSSAVQEELGGGLAERSRRVTPVAASTAATTAPVPGQGPSGIGKTRVASGADQRRAAEHGLGRVAQLVVVEAPRGRRRRPRRRAAGTSVPFTMRSPAS